MFYNKQHSELNMKAENSPRKEGVSGTEGRRGREPSGGQKKEHQAQGGWEKEGIREDRKEGNK